MNLTAQEFLEQNRKSITVIGMSGQGKTYTASMLASQGWTHYSCDEVIGRDYLARELPSPVTKDDLAPLSKFIGKVGNEDQGGLPLDEFKRRQKLYYDAECASLRDAVTAMVSSMGHFIVDSTGSLCEIENAALIDDLGRQTLFVYIRASAEDEVKILERAKLYPKPLFFPPSQFDGWLNDYMRERHLAGVPAIDPDDFATWVFPRLFKLRLPKYQALADRYGITVPSETMKGVATEQDFISMIEKALRE